MASVAEVKSVRRARVRILFDPGAQVSFVSSSLVNVVQAPKVGTAKLSFKGYGSSTVFSETALRSFTLVGVDGDEFDIRALEWQKLDVSISRVPEEVVKRWESRGIVVNDSGGRLEPVCDPIHIII